MQSIGSPPRGHGRLRARVAAVAVPAVLAALLVTTAPASAAAGKRSVVTNFPEGSRGTISWNVSCNIDGTGTAYAPRFIAKMGEVGISHVKKMKIELQFYVPGRGLDSFDFRGESYYRVQGNWGTRTWKTPRADVPGKDYDLIGMDKQFTEGPLDRDWLLVVKFTFDRGVLRKDTTVTQAVALCSPGEGAPVTVPALG